MVSEPGTRPTASESGKLSSGGSAGFHPRQSLSVPKPKTLLNIPSFPIEPAKIHVSPKEAAHQSTKSLLDHLNRLQSADESFVRENKIKSSYKENVHKKTVPFNDSENLIDFSINLDSENPVTQSSGLTPSIPKSLMNIPLAHGTEQPNEEMLNPNYEEMTKAELSPNSIFVDINEQNNSLDKINEQDFEHKESDAIKDFDINEVFAGMTLSMPDSSDVPENRDNGAKLQAPTANTKFTGYSENAIFFIEDDEPKTIPDIPDLCSGEDAEDKSYVPSVTMYGKKGEQMFVKLKCPLAKTGVLTLIVDSGSTPSIIKAESLHQETVYYPNLKLNLCGISGNRESAGACFLPLQFGRKVVATEFHIVSGEPPSCDGILGLNIIQNCVIDHVKKRMTYHEIEPSNKSTIAERTFNLKEKQLSETPFLSKISAQKHFKEL